MGLLQRGSVWLADTFEQNESDEVVYRRRQQPAHPLTIQAVQGQGSGEQDETGGFRTEWASADWIVRRSLLDLRNLAGPFDPEPGDRIETSDGQVFEVVPIAGGPCFQIAPGDIEVRIHTKRVKS